MSWQDYDNRLSDQGNIASALFDIAEALNKLADNKAKQEQKELTSISNKVDQLYQIVRTAYSAQDIQQIKDQLGQIQGHLVALNRLIQKKESP